MQSLHDRVKTFVERHSIGADARSRLLDLVSEVGELAKEHLRSSEYGKQEFKPTEEWTGELGDVLFSLVCLANATGVDLDSAIRQAMDKYEQRLESRGDAGSGN